MLKLRHLECQVMARQNVVVRLRIGEVVIYKGLVKVIYIAVAPLRNHISLLCPYYQTMNKVRYRWYDPSLSSRSIPYFQPQEKELQKISRAVEPKHGAATLLLVRI